MRQVLHLDDGADLKPAIDDLVLDQPLAASYHDHSLTGEWAGCRECHIKPDLLLIYKEEGDGKLIRPASARIVRFLSEFGSCWARGAQLPWLLTDKNMVVVLSLRNPTFRSLSSTIVALMKRNATYLAAMEALSIGDLQGTARKHPCLLACSL